MTKELFETAVAFENAFSKLDHVDSGAPLLCVAVVPVGTHLAVLCATVEHNRKTVWKYREKH